MKKAIIEELTKLKSSKDNQNILLNFIETNNITQYRLAAIIGVTRSAMSQWVTGLRKTPNWLPMMLTLNKILVETYKKEIKEWERRFKIYKKLMKERFMNNVA